MFSSYASHEIKVCYPVFVLLAFYSTLMYLCTSMYRNIDNCPSVFSMQSNSHLLIFCYYISLVFKSLKKLHKRRPFFVLGILCLLLGIYINILLLTMSSSREFRLLSLWNMLPIVIFYLRMQSTTGITWSKMYFLQGAFLLQLPFSLIKL